MSTPLHVLVVDDSAVVRQVVTTLLSNDGDMRVSTAADPVIAIEKMKHARPDVIVLDLEMPRMDGLTFLRKIMREDPIPVVVCSGAGAGTDAALTAMAEGAVDILHKPKVGIRDFLYESAIILGDVVRAAARAHMPRLIASQHMRHAPAIAPKPRVEVAGRVGRVIAIGASTGGPEALREIFARMPAHAPATLVVQHMPEHFTKAFAKRLDGASAMAIKEAEHGDAVIAGRALVAPGNAHMELVRASNGSYVVALSEGPLVSRHRPSVDVLFRSVAAVAGPAGVGVLLTGMGEDGADGLLSMRRAGAMTIAQNEASSVVFGMPAKAIARGAAIDVVALPDMPRAILERADERPTGRREGTKA